MLIAHIPFPFPGMRVRITNQLKKCLLKQIKKRGVVAFGDCSRKHLGVRPAFDVAHLAKKLIVPQGLRPGLDEARGETENK